MSDTKECNICLLKFTKAKRKEVKCSFCDGQPSCSECVQQYLLGSTKKPHCHYPGCKKEWSMDFMYSNFNKSFINGKYKKHLQLIALDREKSKFSESMIAAEKEKQIEKLKKELKSINEEYNKIKRKKQTLRRELFYIESGRSEKKEVEYQYVMKCINDDCNGMIENKNYKCGVCDVKICSKCRTIKEENHKCNEDDVESVKLIKKESRACPTCLTPIHKIEGCNQIWCVKCHTSFDYKTGEINTGVVHNPHYFEFIQNNGTGALRTQGDVPCGGLVNFSEIEHHFPNTSCRQFNRWGEVIGPYYVPSPKSKKIIYLYRRCGEMERFNYRFSINENFEKHRVDFLLGRINEEQLKKRIFLQERKNNRNLKYRQIYQTAQTLLIERFRNLSLLHQSISEKEKEELETEFTAIIKFCHDALKRELKFLNTTNMNFINPETFEWENIKI